MYSLHKLDHSRHSGLIVSFIPGKVFQEKANQNFLSALFAVPNRRVAPKVHEATPLQEVTVNYSVERYNF